jgi:predicted secreted protein
MKGWLPILALTAAAITGCTAGQGMSRGSDTTLLSIAGEIRFTNTDLGKTVQLRRNQKLLISLKTDPTVYGKWTISGINRQSLMLRTKSVRGESALNEVWYYEAIAPGYCTVTLTYTPYDDTIPPKVYKSGVSVSNQQL